MKSLYFVVGVATLVLTPATANGAVFSLGGPLSKLCYSAALSQDSRDQAIDGCSRSLQEEPLAAHDRAATYVNRGILLMTRGQYRGADADFNSALGIDRGLSDAWLNKGFLRLRTGSGREALPLLQKGIDAGTNRQALALFARGVAYEQMGEFRSAYADLKRAHALEPKWSLPTEYLASYQVVSR